MSRAYKSGTQIPGTSKIAVKGDPTQMRKIRCPGCTKLALAQVNDKGELVASCACGRTFRSRPM